MGTTDASDGTHFFEMFFFFYFYSNFFFLTSIGYFPFAGGEFFIDGFDCDLLGVMVLDWDEVIFNIVVFNFFDLFLWFTGVH